MRKVGGPPPTTPGRTPRAGAAGGAARRAPARGAAKKPRVEAETAGDVAAEQGAQGDGLDQGMHRDRTEEAYEQARQAMEGDDAALKAFSGIPGLAKMVEAVRPTGAPPPVVAADHPERAAADQAQGQFLADLSAKGLRGVGSCQVIAGKGGRPALLVSVNRMETVPAGSVFTRVDLANLPTKYQGFDVVVAIPYGNLPLRRGTGR